MARRLAPEIRRQRILDTATALFLDRGYAGTSLNDIVRIAGGSKATLVTEFGNKAGLFAAVMQGGADELLDRLGHLPQGGDPGAVLRHIGRLVLDFYLSPRSLVAYRGVISEGQKEPTMARVFYRQGHARIVAAIAARLEDWQGALLLGRDDLQAEADRFVHLLRSGVYEQVLLGVRRTATAAQRERQVASAVATFLRNRTR
ncbi:MAG: hypothetical protein RLZZ200_631 [Pseudomonadota bacterium]|jgi:AcrR family transcriptional regulator